MLTEAVSVDDPVPAGVTVSHAAVSFAVQFKVPVPVFVMVTF